MRYTFKKEERLCSHILIQELLKEGNSFFVFPFRCVWKLTEQSNSPVQIAFSVPKRKFKHANKRNLVKRQLRNIYRLEKGTLTEKMMDCKKSLTCLLVYNTSDILDYSLLEEKIKTILLRLEEQLFVSLKNNEPSV